MTFHTFCAKFALIAGIFPLLLTALQGNQRLFAKKGTFIDVKQTKVDIFLN